MPYEVYRGLQPRAINPRRKEVDAFDLVVLRKVSSLRNGWPSFA